MKTPGILLVLFVASAAGVPPTTQRNKTGEPPRLRLFPNFAAGQRLHYQLDFRSHTLGNSSGLIGNPQAVKETEISISALVRLDVLSVSPNLQPGTRSVVRLRTTYEKVASTIRTDVPDAEADQLHDRIQRLEKQSLEFTVGADGKVSDVHGLEEAFPQQQTALREWLRQIGFTASLPVDGIYPGMKWYSEPPAAVENMLTGFAWKEESTYLRDEACHTGKMASGAHTETPQDPEVCAVILSAMTLDETSKHSDRTPPEFREKNLRSNGVMSGAGESLTYISLTSGLVVSVTQASHQMTDVTVSSTNSDASFRYTGRVETQSQLSLTDAPAAPPSETHK